MPATRPYQPLLLRILHGLNGILAIAALITGFWTYDTYDGRWGGLPLPHLLEMESIHGTFGLWTLLAFPVFALYAFHRGQRRLIQPDSLEQLAKVGKPIWWYTLHRLTNTIMLLALTFALFSGRMMDSTWLPKGELNHFWYYIHLIAWLVLAIGLALHTLMAARVGGLALLQSVLSWQFRPQDSPGRWSRQIRYWLKHRRLPPP